MIKPTSLLFGLMLVASSQAVGQAGWRLEPGIQAGAFLPLRSLGAFGTAHGRMRDALAAGLSLDLVSRRSAFGLRASGVLGLTKGAEFTPTSACSTGCGPYSCPYPRFAAMAIDVSLRFQWKQTTVRLAAGPGLRGYRVPELACACDPPPPPGAFVSYDVEEFHLARHVGLDVGRPLGRLELGLHIQDYVGRFQRTQRMQHDLLILLSARLR